MLPPLRIRKAWQQSRNAVEALGESKPTDREAYDLLEKRAGHSGEGGELPSFAAWSRYLRDYRRLTNQQKNKPRRGRKGGSMVFQSEA